MTEAADLVLTNAEIHPRAGPETVEALAVRDGRIVRTGDAYEMEFLRGVETRERDCGGRVVLPGFVDAHTHLAVAGRYEIHADLRDAEDSDECVRRLRAHAAAGEEWVLGFGFDDGAWPAGETLTGERLSEADDDRPVAAVREDLHGAVLNDVALDRLDGSLSDADVETSEGGATGRIVEGGVDALLEAVEPDVAGTRELLAAGQRIAHRRGVTAVHDMVARSRTAETYRRLAVADELRLRVRLNYRSDRLDALTGSGLRPNHGGEFVRVGAVKAFADGSIGSRTARLSEPYADAEPGGESRGRWVRDPEALRALVRRVEDREFPLAVHAIGDEAIGATLDAIEAASADPAAARHRIEHAELATDEQIERIARLGVVASMQPNFHKWAGEDGLYARRLGDERRRASNRLAAFAEAGASLAFGSDCMPLDPLFGVHHAVNAPTEGQRLSVTEALRAYTLGAARAGFDEDRLGSLDPGKRADLVVLDGSPWERPARIDEIDVVATAVDGEFVYDAREDGEPSAGTI